MSIDGPLGIQEPVDGVFYEGDEELEGEEADHTVPGDLLELHEILEATGMRQIPKVPNTVEELLALADLPPNFVPRAAWGALNPTSRVALRTAEGNTAHYEGPRTGVYPHSSCASKVRGIQRFHMEGRGWGDIAYNFIICPHGYIFEGRGFGIRSAANGTNEGNGKSYAHCVLIGEGDAFTVEAQSGLANSFGYCRHRGSGDRRWVHSDWKATKCPDVPITNFVRGGMNVGGGVTPAPVPPPAPAPAPPPPPAPAPVNPEKERIAELQRLVGAGVDGIWGPNTEAALARSMVGWPTYVRQHAPRLLDDLRGNGNRALVTWLQRQGNRKFGGGFTEDGLVGPNTNHLIVVGLGQSDGVCGPNGFRRAVQ